MSHHCSSCDEIVGIAPLHQFHHKTKRELRFKGPLFIFSVFFNVKCSNNSVETNNVNIFRAQEETGPNTVAKMFLKSSI